MIAVEKVLFCVPKLAAVPFFHMQLSKTDISGPTHTVGPLFNSHDSAESDVEEEMSHVNRVSCCFCVVGFLIHFSLPPFQLSMPTPAELAIQTKKAKHRR
jgi:hypothetical protein